MNIIIPLVAIFSSLTDFEAGILTGSYTHSTVEINSCVVIDATFDTRCLEVDPNV